MTNIFVSYFFTTTKNPNRKQKSLIKLNHIESPFYWIDIYWIFSDILNSIHSITENLTQIYHKSQIFNRINTGFFDTRMKKKILTNLLLRWCTNENLTCVHTINANEQSRKKRMVRCSSSGKLFLIPATISWKRSTKWKTSHCSRPAMKHGTIPFCRTSFGKPLLCCCFKQECSMQPHLLCA